VILLKEFSENKYIYLSNKLIFLTCLYKIRFSSYNGLYAIRDLA